MTVPPGQTAHVVNIAHAVETRRIVRVEHAAAEEAVVWVRSSCVDESLEPVGPRESIGVEEYQPFGANVLSDRKVVACCKSEVSPCTDEDRFHGACREVVHRPVRRAVINHNDAKVPERLGVQRRKRALQIGTRRCS